MKRTKIVCTLGPSSSDYNILRDLAVAGMDVARLNFSHGTYEWHSERIALIRELEAEIGRPLSVLQDLCGPKMRVGEMPLQGVELRQGENCILWDKPYAAGDPPRLPVPLPGLLAALKPGGAVYMDDAQIELEVLECGRGEVRCIVRHGGKLLSRKGVTAPGAAFAIDTLTEKDLTDLAFGLEKGVDWVAVSFVRLASDLQPVRDAIAAAGADTRIVAKIEKPEAIVNLDEILDTADAVMVARGDLGVETPLWQVPILQKEIIRRCGARGKPVITATQMLESMIHAPRPTRAEVSDVANAIFDGTSAVMLSGETAMGAFPVKTVETMTAIAQSTEPHLPYDRLLSEAISMRAADRTTALCQGVAQIADDLNAAAILCSTTSGETARRFAQIRPRMPIIAGTHLRGTYRRLPLFWGVRPLLVPETTSTDERMAAVIQGALAAGWIHSGQTVVIAVGATVGTPGHTNTFRVETV